MRRTFTCAGPACTKTLQIYARPGQVNNVVTVYCSTQCRDNAARPPER